MSVWRLLLAPCLGEGVWFTSLVVLQFAFNMTERKVPRRPGSLPRIVGAPSSRPRQKLPHRLYLTSWLAHGSKATIGIMSTIEALYIFDEHK